MWGMRCVPGIGRVVGRAGACDRVRLQKGEVGIVKALQEGRDGYKATTFAIALKL